MARRAVGKALGFGLAVGLAVGLSACADRPAREARATPPQPAIWRVADADSEVWLFGSVHMLPRDMRWRTPALDRALAEADVLYFETAAGPEAARDVADVVAARGVAAQGATLSGRLAAPDAARLKRVAAEIGVDLATLERTEPWLAALNLSIAFVARQGHVLEAGVEHVLDGEARRLGLERRYFETPRAQLGLIANLPEADQLSFLRASLRQIEEDASLVDAMDDAWVKGDVEALEAMLMAQLSEAGPAVYEALLRTRNAAWAEEIDRFMQGSGDALVVVGAAHLLGPDSVQALLAEKGRIAERR
jgi:hypothetical protein